MENESVFTEIYKEFKERLSSPFIFSFILSWFIINWRIWIGLFFYDIEDLYRDGYHSFICLISTNIAWYSGLVKPLIGAFLYTFVYPYLRDFIYVFNTKRKKATDDEILEIRKNGSISVSKYIRLRDKYSERTKALQEIIDAESDHKVENIELKGTIGMLKMEKEKVDDELQRWKDINNSNLIAGNWEYTEGKTVTTEKSVYECNIQGTTMNLESSDGKIKIKGDILLFYKHPVNNNIHLLINWANDGTSFAVNARKDYQKLKVMQDMQLLIGESSEGYDIKYEKQN